MTGSNLEKEVVKLDPNGPDYEIIVKALKNFEGLTAEGLKMFVERRGHHGPLVYLFPQKDDRDRSHETDYNFCLCIFRLHSISKHAFQ